MNIVNNRPRPIPKEFSSELADVIFKCLEKDPKNRVSIHELEKMFSSIENPKVLVSCNKATEVTKKTETDKQRTMDFRPFTCQNVISTARFNNPLFRPREITILHRTAQFTLLRTQSDRKVTNNKISISQLRI